MFFTTLVDAKIDEEVKEKVLLSKEKLGNVQDTLFQLREDLSELQTENENLKKQLSEYEEWNNIKNSYSLTQTKGSAIVYEYKHEPKHYICTNCFNNKETQILQDTKSSDGSFSCPKCETSFYINRKEKKN